MTFYIIETTLPTWFSDYCPSLFLNCSLFVSSFLFQFVLFIFVSLFILSSFLFFFYLNFFVYFFLFLFFFLSILIFWFWFFSSSGPKDPMSLCHGVASVVRPSVLPSVRPSFRPSVLPSVHSFQNASSSSFLNRFWFWLFHKIGLGGGFKTSTQNCEIHYLW